MGRIKVLVRLQRTLCPIIESRRKAVIDPCRTHAAANKIRNEAVWLCRDCCLCRKEKFHFNFRVAACFPHVGLPREAI